MIIELVKTRIPQRFGLDAKTARQIGPQNLSKLVIEEAIAKARAELSERAELTADWVIDELRKLAGADLAVVLQIIPAAVKRAAFPR